MICPLCGEDRELYVVKYPIHQGLICHECNIEIMEEQVKEILDTYDPRDMSLMLRQRSGFNGSSYPIRQKNRQLD